MEDITAEDITLRSGGVGFLHAEAKEVRQERLRSFIPHDSHFLALADNYFFLVLIVVGDEGQRRMDDGGQSD